MIMPTLTELIMSNTKQAIKTLSTFMLLLMLVSLMGWCAIEPPDPKPLTLEYDRQLVKEDVKRVQPRILAEETDRFNRHMDTIAKGKK